MIEDAQASPRERLLALKEVAEEARAYKMGGEDKIRVAVNTAEIVRATDSATCADRADRFAHGAYRLAPALARVPPGTRSLYS